MTSYQLNIVIHSGLLGYPDYVLTTDNKIFNIKKGIFIKKCLRKYTLGYNLNRKFVSIKNIKYVDNIISNDLQKLLNKLN